MSQIETVSFFGHSVSLYALLAALLCFCAAAALVFSFRRQSIPTGRAALFAFLGALFGLLFGRAIYCAVRSDMMLDPFGRSLGLTPFFDFSIGSFSVVGVLAGVLLSSLPASLRSGMSASRLLDAAVIPGFLLLAAMRFIEPLCGQGYGPMSESPVFCLVPFGIQNGWGVWSISVCFFEGLLVLAVIFFLLRTRWNHAGSLTLCALVLLAACQIMPESLRRDGALRIFIFARVTQIGYAVLLFTCAAIVWHRASVRGVAVRSLVIEITAVLFGILLLIGCEFGLDKTDWSHYLVYGIMILILVILSVLIMRRIQTEDRAV